MGSLGMPKRPVVKTCALFGLGEINDSQREAWRKTIEVFDEEASLD